MSRASSTSAESDAFDDEGSEVKDAEQGANDKANVEHLDHTTRIAMHSGSVILPPQSPKPAKPSACRSTTPTTPAPSSSSPPDAPMATSIPMPGLANLILHSPSATIVGTPFALDTDITRFEYPFPDTSLSPPGLYEYHNTSSGSSSGGGSASGSGRLGVPALSHSSSSGSSGSSSSSASCTSSAAPSPSHPPSHAHQQQHHDPHHQHHLPQHPHQHVHIVSRHATHPIHIAHIAHPHAISNHPLTQSPPGSAFPLALTSSLTSPSAKSSHPSHPSYAHAHTRSHHSHHHHHHAHSHPNSTPHTHPTHHTHTQHHPLSPTASALLADSDREEPPVPPGLLKKKHRWSLGLLAAPQRTSTGTQREGAGGQRRSATADHARRGDTSAQNNDIYDGAAEYFDVSPGSCTSESSSCSAASDALHALHISDSDTLQGSDTEPSKLGEEGEVKEVEEVEGEAVDLTARSALVG